MDDHSEERTVSRANEISAKAEMPRATSKEKAVSALTKLVVGISKRITKDMMINHRSIVISTLLSFLMIPVSMNAQQLFTLEDLNYGGKNYHNLSPKNMWLTWWGDQLIQTDVEECYTIDAKTGKKEVLFTLDEVNKWIKSDDERYVRHLMNVTFPYPDKPLAAMGNRHAYVLVDFKAKQLVWQDSISGQDENDWCPASRATTYIKGNQLYVTDGNGQERQITKDGSREIVYGQSVHRNEFGIEKGTFWSPDGQRLAFYRMDQNMVTDYPQVDLNPYIEKGIAKVDPDKYPMAGTNTHVVTIGVYVQAPSRRVLPFRPA